MPRPYRSWLTPVALAAAVLGAMIVAGLVMALSSRCQACGLQLRPVASERIMVLESISVIGAAGAITLIGGLLQLFAVRPVRPQFLVRSAALQTVMAAIGPLALLRDAMAPRLMLVVVLAASAFLPALGLSGVAWLRHPRYRRIPRRYP